jgi:ATP-binding cassette, subfamily B, multidrug efflux pump
MEKGTSLTPLKKYAAKVVLAPFLKLFEVATELLSPFLVRYIIDDGIKNNNLSYALMLTGIMLGLSVLGFGVTMIAQYLAARVSSDFGYDLRKDVYHQMTSLSERQLNDFGKGKILTLLSNDAFSLQNGVMMFMRLFLRPPFLLIGSCILSFIVDYRAGLIFLVSISLSAGVLLLVMALSPKHYAAIQGNLDEITTLSSDSLKGARPIRAFNKEGFEEDKFQKSIDSYEKNNMGMAKLNALINPLTFCFINLGLVLVVYVGKFGISDGFLTTGEVVSLISYLVSSLTALVMWSRMIVSLNKASASKKRLDRFLALAPLIENAPKEGKTQENDGKTPLFSFDDVSLTYGNKTDKPAVEHLSFQAYSGQWIGLIGGTGSGKSTTLELLERLYEPTEGEILYKGEPLKDYDLDKLHQEIAFVSQKPALFKGTIKSNLLLGKPNATDEEIQVALRDSLAEEFVSKYPDGILHPVEEMGENFSGGQKQRLLIARALLKDSEILILDDSTSALDFLSDQKVRSNIAKRSSLTKLIVSQRASSLKDCDLILVYDNGKIVAQGTAEELLKSCSIYQEIDAMQRSQA